MILRCVGCGRELPMPEALTWPSGTEFHDEDCAKRHGATDAVLKIICAREAAKK